MTLHTRDGKTIPIGSVTFTPQEEKVGFEVELDHAQFKDFFLSMREFKCVDGGEEVHCHVPYPYERPGFVTPDDLDWLEHSLLFLYKTPKEFGANLWNGVYYVMELTDDGIIGTAHAIDLNHIAAPPKNPAMPPFSPADRHEIPEGSRLFGVLTIK